MTVEELFHVAQEKCARLNPHGEAYAAYHLIEQECLAGYEGIHPTFHSPERVYYRLRDLSTGGKTEARRALYKRHMERLTVPPKRTEPVRVTDSPRLGKKASLNGWVGIVEEVILFPDDHQECKLRDAFGEPGHKIARYEDLNWME